MVFLLLLLSSIMLNLALIYPANLSWLVFIFLIPLFYVAFKRPAGLSFIAGFFWGVTFFLIHFSGFLFLFYEQANNTLGVVIPIIISIYCALYGGLWFSLANYISRLCSRDTFVTFLSWTLWTYLYFVWIRYGV